MFIDTVCMHALLKCSTYYVEHVKHWVNNGVQSTEDSISLLTYSPTEIFAWHGKLVLFIKVQSYHSLCYLLKIAPELFMLSP